MSAFTKNIWRSIKEHLSRFLALFAIIALGAGVFAGLRMFVPDMHTSADEYYDKLNMIDFRVTSTLGLVDDDLQAIRELDEIEGASPVILNEVSLSHGSKSVQLSLEGIDMDIARQFERAREQGLDQEFPNYVNRLRILEGRLPEKPDEIVISNINGSLKLGDKLSVSSIVGHDKPEDYFVTDTFTIVGFIASPEFISDSYGVSPDTGTTFTNYGYLGFDSYKDTEVYTDIFATAKGAKETLAYSDEYDSAVKDAELALKKLGQKREDLRQEEVHSKALKKIEDGQAELDDAKAEAQNKLDEAQQKLKDAQAKIESGTKELRDGEQKVKDGWATLRQEENNANAKLQDAEQQILHGEAELEVNRPKVEEGLSKLPGLLDRRQEVLDGIDQIEQGYKALDTLAELKAKKAQVQSQLDAGSAQFSQLDAGIAQAEKAIEDIKKAPASEFLPHTPPTPDPSTNASDTADEKPQPESEPDLALAEANRQKRLAEAQANLDALKAKKAEAQKTYDASKAQAEAGLAQINEGIAQIEAQGISKSMLDAKYAEASSGLKQIDDGIAQIRQGAQEFDEAKAKLENARADLENRRAEAAQKISQGMKDLKAAESKITSSKTELEQGKKDYEEGLAEYQKNKKDTLNKLEAEQNKLDSAREDLKDIPDALWYVLGRSANPSYATYEANAERMTNITAMFPVFFFLVAALVSLTTMTRMVESERIEIGTLKALGYSNSRISTKYLLFAFLASAFGAGLGIALGIYILPHVIWMSYKTMYMELPFLVEPHAKDMIVAFVLSVAIAMGATWASARLTLSERPSTLMLPRAPKPGKRILLERIPIIWNHISFTSKVTARNLFRYKKRMIMTVIGIAGCTALLLIGFGIGDALKDFIPRHYNNILQYNQIVGVDTAADPKAKTAQDDSLTAQAMEELYDSKSWDFVANVSAIAQNPTGDPKDIPFTSGGESARTGISVQAQMRDARSDSLDKDTEDSGIMRDVTITVFKDADELNKFFNLVDYQTGEKLSLKNSEIILTQKLAENLLLSAGDSFELSLGADEEKYQVQVDDIAKFYVGQYIFMTQESYTKIFGERADYNVILNMDKDIEHRYQKASELKESEAISSVSFPDELGKSYSNLSQSLDMLVVLIIFVSGTLAFIVLYNLTNINVEERRSEIATIKVLGFFDKEVYSYVFRETIILSIIGIIVGLPLGKLLCTFIMRSAEIDYLMFIREIEPLSYLYAVVITLIFTFIVCGFMTRKLKKIDMVSSLKAVD